MFEWEEAYGKLHLMEKNKSLPMGNLVWATIQHRKVTLVATFEMGNVDGEKIQKTFSCSDLLSYVSSGYAKWKRERAEKKAKKWCHKMQQDYIDSLM